MSIDTGIFKKAVEEHMDAQPYSATCCECDNNVIVHATIDNDYDLTITVEPCEYCLQKAREENTE